MTMLRTLLLTLLIGTALSTHAQPSDIETIKSRVITTLLEPGVDDTRVETILGKMNKDGSFSDINYKDLSRLAGFPHRHHTYNLVYLAKAYRDTTSVHHHSEKLIRAITAGYGYWVGKDYQGENWHNNQISTPRDLVDLMLLVGDELPRDLVKKGQPIIARGFLDAWGARPSGDRIVIAGTQAKNALFMGDTVQLDSVMDVIEGEMKFATGGQGLQHDYSFHHRVDRVNNTDSYGYTKYANAYGEWAHYAAGTGYAFPDEKVNMLIDYYLDGICRQHVYGIYRDVSVQNRNITHKRTFKPRGTREIERLLPLTDYRQDELQEILALRRGEAKPSRSFAAFFWQSEHFVFQRPHFYTTVRMYSTRNMSMEYPYNGPGKLNHHRADGTNHLQLKGNEYLNIWPVYDWQKIPGTTVAQKPELPGIDEIKKYGVRDFVGAVTDGRYGAVAFDFKSPIDYIAAHKAWFFFDNEYMCLGAGLKNKSRTRTLATTVDQALLRGTVTAGAGGTASVLPAGSRTVENAEWIHHHDVGYIFPEPAAVNVLNRTQTGRWCDITDEKNISADTVKKDVFMLWFDHGTEVNGGTYQYVVVPGITGADMATPENRDRKLTVLANTPACQAVLHTGLGLCQLLCYKADTVRVTPELEVELHTQGAVMLKLDKDRITEISASDPARRLGKVSLSVTGIYTGTGENITTVPDKKNNRTLIMIDLPQGVYAGKSVTVGL